MYFKHIYLLIVLYINTRIITIVLLVYLCIILFITGSGWQYIIIRSYNLNNLKRTIDEDYQKIIHLTTVILLTFCEHVQLGLGQRRRIRNRFVRNELRR